MLTANGYLESSKDILPGDRIKVTKDWNEHYSTSYTFTVHAVSSNIRGDVIVYPEGIADPFTFNQGPYLIKLLERTSSDDPLAHSTLQHDSSSPVYSPECRKCIQLFYQMYQAMLLMSEGLRP